jgi:hypothetical protein
MILESKEPIVQTCKIRYQLKADDPINDLKEDLYYSDCSITHGTSGSILLQRVEGSLVVVGIVTILVGPFGKNGHHVDWFGHDLDKDGHYRDASGAMVDDDSAFDYLPYNVKNFGDKPPSYSILDALPDDIQSVAKHLIDGSPVQ